MATDKNKYLIGSSTIYNTPMAFTSYQGLQFNGNCILDNICIRNIVQTDTIAKSEDMSIEPDWTPDVIFKTVFNYTTDSANVFGLLQSQTKFNLGRQEVGSDVIKNVAILDPNITSFIDYKVEGQKSFNYYLSAKNDTQLSEPLVTDLITTSFFGVYLLDASDIDDYTNNNDVICFKLDFNATVAAVSNNADVTTYRSYQKYDQYYIGNTNYLSGSVTSLLGYWDENGDDVTWSPFYLEQFRSFINNGQEKIMKFKNGKTIRVVTFNSNTESMSYVHEDVQNQPTDITFGFRECADV